MTRSSPGLFVQTYYRVKPFVPRSLLYSLRRRHARKILERSGSRWPISESAAPPPDGWNGWPEGKRFSVILTHDVESEAGLRRVRQLAELEMKHGFRSSFNFVPEGEYEVPSELREWLVDHGFEVGVHDLHHDGFLYSSRRGFRKRAERINHYLAEWGATGFRSGFMLRQLDWLHDLDIGYDSSTFDTDPFEPQPDGVDTVFPYWIAGENGGGYLELPYTLPQDSSLFLVLGESTPDVWLHKLDWLAEVGGMAMINTHPDYVRFHGEEEDAMERSYPSEHYEKFLEHLATRHEGGYWHALPKDLANWFAEEAMSSSMRTRNLEEAVVPAVSESADGAGTGKTKGDGCGGDGEGASGGPECDAADAVLAGKRVAVLLLSKYPNDPRPRRAAEALAEKGMIVELICLKQTPEEPSRDRINGVDVRRLPMQHKRGGALAYLMHYASFLTACFFMVSARCLTRRYHLVHVHNMPDILVFSALLPRLLGAKLLLDLHDPMPELMRTIFGISEGSKGVKLLKFFEKLSMGFATSVITVNETCKKIFASRSCRADKIHVVMNSPDENMFSLREPKRHEGESGAKAFVIMYHGSLVERNGLGLAVEAVARVRKKVPWVELRIFGEQSEFLEGVLASAGERGLLDCIRYEGSRTIEEIVKEIDHCDLGIVPNLRSIFTEINTPTRIFEFLYRGKPVVAPSADGIHEYFREEDLVCFELGDAADLADKIEYVVRNPDRVLEITERGQAVCVAHRWSKEREILTGLASKLLGGGDSAAKGS